MDALASTQQRPETHATRVPLSEIVAEAAVEFSVVVTLLRAAREPIYDALADHLMALLTMALRRSGRDLAWLDAQEAHAVTRVNEIRDRLKANAQGV